MGPIVLHHGLFGFAEIRVGFVHVRYFAGIERALNERGYALVQSQVHPTGGIERRARELKESIHQQLQAMGRPGARVAIIAHSLGGLDARYMISRLGMDDRVSALVTVSTPHRGTAYADWCVRNLGQKLGAFRLMRRLGLDMQGVMDLTTDSCAYFNEQTPDAPGVRYFSVSAARPWRRVAPFAMAAGKLIQEIEGDNDGMVSVASARWGEHLGTWPVDHFEAINRHYTPRLGRAGEEQTIPLKYVQIAERLAREGLVDRQAAAHHR